MNDSDQTTTDVNTAIIHEKNGDIETALPETNKNDDAPTIDTTSEASIADRIRMLAPDVGLEPDELDFYSMVSPKYDNDGNRYYTDIDKQVRYYPADGRLEVTRDRIEREIVADINQRALTVEDQY